MLIAIIAHFSRRRMADGLAKQLAADVVFMDEQSVGANANHLRAIKWAAEQVERVIIIEEDAIPIKGFRGKAEAWLERFPDDLCSFYLGTGRPPQYQPEIATKLIEADKRQADYIMLPTLIHGVCYSIPQQHIRRILDNWPLHLAADYAVGRAWGREVIYPSHSLVDHADGESVEKHPDGEKRTGVRRAWQLAN